MSTTAQESKPFRSHPLNLDCAATFDLLAREYYLADRHPTCANFAALHELVRDMLRPWVLEGERYLEVGCGSGQLDLIAQNSEVVLTDVSEEMLSLARHRTEGRVVCRRMNALEPDFPDRYFAGVAAFLADPYNTTRFYEAIRNVIKPTGFLAVTLPNHLWASTLRRRLGFPPEETRFIFRHKYELAVPSITRSPEGQVHVLNAAGFAVLQFKTLALESVERPTPSHHVRYAAEDLEMRATEVPLLDVYLCRID